MLTAPCTSSTSSYRWPSRISVAVARSEVIETFTAEGLAYAALQDSVSWINTIPLCLFCIEQRNFRRVLKSGHEENLCLSQKTVLTILREKNFLRGRWNMSHRMHYFYSGLTCDNLWRYKQANQLSHRFIGNHSFRNHPLMHTNSERISASRTKNEHVMPGITRE